MTRSKVWTARFGRAGGYEHAAWCDCGICKPDPKYANTKMKVERVGSIIIETPLPDEGPINKCYHCSTPYPPEALKCPRCGLASETDLEKKQRLWSQEEWDRYYKGLGSRL